VVPAVATPLADPPVSKAAAAITNPKDVTEECTLSTGLQRYYKQQNKRRACKVPGTKQTRFAGNLKHLKIRARENNRVQFTEEIDCVTKDGLTLTFCGDTKPTSLDIECGSPPCIWNLCNSGSCETKTVTIAIATISRGSRRMLDGRRLSDHDIDDASTQCDAGESWNESSEQCIPDNNCDKIVKLGDGTITLDDICE